MKAWRQLSNQQRFRRETERETGRPFTGRIGNALKHSTGKVRVTFPSLLLQRMFINVGLWKV